MNKISKKNIKNIKVIITDVDGVLNDGTRFYSKNNEVMKAFHVILKKR